MLHLATPHELLEATFSERRRRDWTAVAPELQPFVGSQRWPSGAPLPNPIRLQVTRRARAPPWVPPGSWAIGAAFLAVFVFAPCDFIVLTYRDDFLYNGGDDICWLGRRPWGVFNMIYVCDSCAWFAVVVVVLVTVLVYGVFRANKTVERHVNCLYVLYALAHTRTSGSCEARELLHHVAIPAGASSNEMLYIDVFSDGSCDLKYVERCRHEDGGHTHTRTVSEHTVHSAQRAGMVGTAVEPLLGGSTV